MSPMEYFNVVTEYSAYAVGYITDGWTKELNIKARSPDEAMMETQNAIGDICNITYVERM